MDKQIHRQPLAKEHVPNLSMWGHKKTTALAGLSNFIIKDCRIFTFHVKELCITKNV